MIQTLQLFKCDMRSLFVCFFPYTAFNKSVVETAINESTLTLKSDENRQASMLFLIPFDSC